MKKTDTKNKKILPKKSKKSHDIRMVGFLKRHDIEDMLKLIDENIKILDSEEISFENAIDRVTSEDIISNTDVPSFDRSAMDGYAVLAEDTYGASQNNPLILKIVGEVTTGKDSNKSLNNEEAISIMTGAKLPKGADAVIMAENTEIITKNNNTKNAKEKTTEIKIFTSVTPGKNVSKQGEDIKKKELVIPKNTIIKPQHIGVLSSIQKTKINVYKKPSVAIIVTGDEIISPNDKKEEGKTVDASSFMLTELIKKSGATPVKKGIIKDDKEKIKHTIISCKEDLIIVTGGTSVGNKDFIPTIISENGKLLIHGVNIRPGSPTGFGIINNKPIFMLPGNPAASMVSFDAFVIYAIKKLQNIKHELFSQYKKQTVILERKITSEIGRTDFVRVKIINGKAEPIRVSGAGILSSMTRSNGIIIIPKNKEGLNEGESVEVFLF